MSDAPLRPYIGFAFSSCLLGSNGTRPAPAISNDLQAFYGMSREFFMMRHSTGIDAVLKGWARIAAGETSLREGLVFSF